MITPDLAQYLDYFKNGTQEAFHKKLKNENFLSFIRNIYWDTRFSKLNCELSTLCKEMLENNLLSSLIRDPYQYIIIDHYSLTQNQWLSDMRPDCYLCSRLNLKLTILIVAYDLLDQLLKKKETKEMVVDALQTIEAARKKYDISPDYACCTEYSLRNYIKKKYPEYDSQYLMPVSSTRFSR